MIELVSIFYLKYEERRVMRFNINIIGVAQSQFVAGDGCYSLIIYPSSVKNPVGDCLFLRHAN